MRNPAARTNRRSMVIVLAATVALLLSLLPFSSVLAAVPATPSTPDLEPASDTGLSDTDNITIAVNGLVFTGTAEAGSTVKIYMAGSTLIGTDTASGGGLYSVTTTVALPVDASSSITATATNGSGEGAASAPLTVTTDQTTPAAPSTPNLDAASDTGTSSIDNITADTTPTLSGTSEAGAMVQLFAADGPPVGTLITSGTTWTITSIELAAGTYLFRAIQIDAAGNDVSPLSGGLSVTINTSVPAAPSTPDLDTASDTGTSTSDNITSDLTPTLSGTAEAGSTVELFAGATSVGTAAATGGNWQITSGALASGTYAFTATATNVAGTSVASGALSVTILSSKYIVTSSGTTPVPGAAVTITAQLADSSGFAVPTAGVVVTWSKTGTGGTVSSATSTTNASGVATVAFTVSTTVGTIHTVTATSPGSITGTSPNITVTLPSATLSLSSSASTTTWRQFVTLTAEFSGTDGGNRLLSFQRMTAQLPGTWVTIGSATTNPSGHATFSYGPPYNTQFRAVFAGATNLAAVNSNTVTVRVRHKVSLSPGAGTTTIVRAGTRVTYTATSRPTAPAGLQRVTFLIYKRVNGIWTFRTSASVPTVNGVASFSSRWSRGEWYIRARGNATAYNTTAYSSLSKVTAR